MTIIRKRIYTCRNSSAREIRKPSVGNPEDRRKARDRRDVNRVFAHRPSLSRKKTSRPSPGFQKKQAAEKERPALTKTRTRHPKSFSRITSGPPAKKKAGTISAPA